ncbi:MAG: sulfite exporter TauE/SafE family protein [Parachlamydiaceae bacterium]|nr:sulfite exporter TauE/SafE family protein [Parachlamydiaceae bacterium]
MSLLVAMLPFYLFGNLHCLGMCGPLVMAIGAHRFRTLYFIGRLLSFSLAGMIAGAIGAVLNIFFKAYHLAATTSFLFGAIIIVAGLCTLFGWNYPGHNWLGKRLAPLNRTLSLLMLRDRPLTTFLFGFFTVMLPCGQTLVVFSACALSASALTGLLNGFVFALLTSPSLFFAMRAHQLFKTAKDYYNLLMGMAALLIGALSLCRGMAEIELIPHLSFGIPFVHAHPFVIY